MSKKRIVVFSTGLLLITVGVISLLIINAKKDINPVTQQGGSSQTVKTNDTATKNITQSQSVTTQSQLVYLIEEEKLAHDVYTVMYQKYGAKVFGNILESESTHQNRVLTLLEERNITDPRSEELGKFNNQELQALYDTLIEKGNVSANEAYKVGIIIEEKDIVDISKQLATTSDSDVIATLEALRQGSENHLRAFNKQIR